MELCLAVSAVQLWLSLALCNHFALQRARPKRGGGNVGGRGAGAFQDQTTGKALLALKPFEHAVLDFDVLQKESTSKSIAMEGLQHKPQPSLPQMVSKACTLNPQHLLTSCLRSLVKHT